MTADGFELQQLNRAFRRARVEANAALTAVTKAYDSFLSGRGPGPSASQLADLQSTRLAEEVACRRYLARLEELSKVLTGTG